MAVHKWSNTRGETADGTAGSGVTVYASTAPALSVTADAEADTLVTLANTTLQGLEAAVTAAAATAQGLGAGNAGAAIDTWDTAWIAVLAALDNVQAQVTILKAATLAAEVAAPTEALVIAADAAADAVVTASAATQALEAAVTAAAAAAQLIGTGDASAEIDTWDTAWIAILASINALQLLVTAAKAATLASETRIAAEEAGTVVVAVTLTSGMARSEVLHCLERIEMAIMAGKWPPV